MKVTKTLPLVNCTSFSKICLSSRVSIMDSSHYSYTLGYRSSGFSLLNPIFVQSSLKVTFSLLEYFVKFRYNALFIVRIKDPILLLKFSQICKDRNFWVIQESDLLPGFSTNNSFVRTVVVSLFLDPEKTELVQRELASTNTPLISFNDTLVNKSSSSMFVGGNYDSLSTQALILTLLSICLEKRKKR